MQAGDWMIREVITISPQDKLAYAKLKMLRHNIGALPVVDSQRKLLGILTMRDLDLTGGDLNSLNVSDLMTRDLIVVQESTPLKQVIELMLSTGIQRIPVVDPGGKLMGLVTQTCVIRAALEILRKLENAQDKDTDSVPG